MTKLKGGNKTIETILTVFVAIIGIALIFIGVADILLSLKISLSTIPHTGGMNYFLLLGIWIGIIALLTGISILFPGIKISTMSIEEVMIMLSIKAILIGIALLIYNFQKVEYTTM